MAIDPDLTQLRKEIDDMPETRTGGKLADPAWRRERAAKAGRARTTPRYHLAQVREFVERTRADQGLDDSVDDLTLARVASLIEADEAGGDR